MEIPEVKLTRSVRAVLTALHHARGRKLAVGHIAADAHLSPDTVRKSLAVLGKAKLVQHVLSPGADRQPPRLVYWLTHDGNTLAAGQRERTPVTGGR